MDDGRGNLIPISEKRANQIESAFQLGNRGITLKSGVFRIGEQVEVKGSLFVISSVGRHTLGLRLENHGKE